MQIPLLITFQGVEKSDAIEHNIIERFRKLKRHFNRITSGRVVVSAPHRNAEKGKTYRILIEVDVPDRRPIVVKHEAEIARASDDLVTGLREAFDTAKRRLDACAARLATTSRIEHARRRPALRTSAREVSSGL